MKQLTAKLIIALSLLLAVSAIQAECTPSLIGSPCAQGGIASASQIEPGLTLAAGNPVHLVTGNKYQRDVDLPSNPTAPGLELIRHYNAMDARGSVLGRGWVLSYETRLYRVRAGWQIVQADGGRINFPDESAGPDKVHHTRHGRLDHSNRHHNWFWPSGTVIRFDEDGQLVAIRWPSGESVYVVRHSDDGPLKGTIQNVHNDRAQTLTFHYGITGPHARLVAVDTPLGRFRYDHDTPQDAQQEATDFTPADSSNPHPSTKAVQTPYRLVQVTRPDALQRHYLYEAKRQSGHPYALTGIELSSAATQQRQRTNTWVYDTQGRVSESINGAPQSLLTFDYQRTPSARQPGLTVVSNEHQQKTVFHTAIRGGRYVLTSVHGAGCFGCAAPGTQADYDELGRLISVNGTRIQRTPTGAVRTLHPAQSGWPGLTLSYNAEGLRDHWHSTITGTERIRYDAQGLPVERRFADGGTIAMEYDVQHRPVTIHEQQGDTRTTTRLSWSGHRLIRIEHPAETESRHYDGSGRVTKRKIMRDATGSGYRLHSTERFSYDENHRMTRHYLPEGGSLAYKWGQGPQLKAIYWHDINGQKHKIIDTRPGLPGYRYGNGLHLDTAAGPDHLIRQLQLRYQDHLIWSQELSYDIRQRIVAEKDYSGSGSGSGLGRGIDAAPHAKGMQHTPGQAALSTSGISAWHYAYDDYARLTGYQRTLADATPPAATTDKAVSATAGATPDTRSDADRDVSPGTAMTTAGAKADSDTTWLAWHADGSLAAIRSQTGSARPALRRNASGLALHADGYDLSYGASRRLEHIMRKGRTIVHYRHNAFGYRISRQTPEGQHSDYFYLNNQLVAQADHNGRFAAQDTAQPRITRRYVYAHHVPVAVIDYSPQAPAGRYYAVHADLQGAPRLMTDQERRVRWQADYSPLGQAVQRAGDMQLELRLPGQVEDPATGWHDNLLRTYLPQWGHYLEPDPLGPVPGNQAYGYASQQPRRYADPMGLLLFAFDGTRQSADTQSNVWKMSQYYLDGPVHYHPGPGNSMFIDWDALAAHQAAQIIETQWKWLLLELSRPQAATEITPIDILGFSRGAALARHFGNMISQNVTQGLFQFHDPVHGSVSACVDLRFMGLFDTVAQFGVAGTQNRNYDLSIAAAWEWVAHAVALHERRWLFPLTSARSTYDHNVVEAPFIGAHADIGGGILPSSRGAPGGRGDLSDVALNWMIWQARAASVPMGEISDDHGTITQPILHDWRSAAIRTVQDGDRSVNAPDGQNWLNYQDDHPRLGRALREQTEHLITRHDNWRSHAGAEVGIVNMDGYAQWLYDELGWHALPV